MEIGLVLGLLKVAIEAFRDERGDRYSRLIKKYNKIEKEWQDEMARPDSSRSDFALDTILFDSTSLARLIVAEPRKEY